MMTPKAQQDAIEAIRKSLLSSHSRDLRVLLIEDDETDASLIIKVLSDFNLSVTWVKTIDEALRPIATSDFWVVFLDMKLSGGQSGLDFLSAVKSIRTDYRVVVLTGAFSEDSEECKQALRQGAVAVMLKPITAEQIRLIFGSP